MVLLNDGMRIPVVSLWRRGGLLFVDGRVSQFIRDAAMPCHMFIHSFNSSASCLEKEKNGGRSSLVGKGGSTSCSESYCANILPRANTHTVNVHKSTLTFASRYMSTSASKKKRNSKRVVELTESALKRMQVLVQGHPKGQGDTTYIRLGVKRRGCNGLAYTLQYDTEKKKFDEEVDYSLEGYDGVKVLIDAGAIMHVLGTRMDFVEDDVRSEFVFINPNASGTCGCGESFTTDSDEFATNSKKNQ
jgi:iron-sulfur cluster assembly accessory protein